MKLSTKAAVVVGIVAVATVGAISPSSAVTPLNPEIDKGAGWLAGQLENGKIPSTWSPGTTDWGLTADTIFAMTSRHVAGEATDTATDALASNVLSYISPSGGASRSAGGVAKTLLVAASQNRDANAFGGQDLVATLESMQASAGADAGRYKDVGTSNDYSSSFSQSLAIIGLSRLGRLSPDSVTFLLNMQCTNGGFPYSPSFTTSRCDSNSDVDNDATAMVIQALSDPAVGALTGVAEAKASAAAYLVSDQQASGAFDSPPWIPDNASTTGLAASSLRLAGEDAAADKATAWLQSLQLTCANAGTSKAKPHVGSIAADPATLASLKTVGVDDSNVDQLRRSTSQAVFGFADSESFATLNRSESVAGVPARSCPVVEPREAPAPPRFVGANYAASMRAGAVNFDAGPGNQLLIRARNSRGVWSGWRLVQSRAATPVATPSVVQAVARKDGLTSRPVSAVVSSSRSNGSVRGCAAFGPAVVKYPSTQSALVQFRARPTKCAAISVQGHAGWRTIGRGQAAIRLPIASNHPTLLKVRTGNQTVAISLLAPR